MEAVALAVHGNSEMLTIHSANDVAKIIKEKTNLTYDVTVHYKEKTEEINKRKIFHQIHFSRRLKSRRAGGECQLSLLLM